MGNDLLPFIFKISLWKFIYNDKTTCITLLCENGTWIMEIGWQSFMFIFICLDVRKFTAQEKYTVSTYAK